MGLTAAAARVSLCAACLALGWGCVEELELEASEASALYVDGVVFVDSTAQRLALGRIDGLREQTIPIAGAEVSVTDRFTGTRYGYEEVAPGQYAAEFVGRYDRSYQLEVTLAGQGTYRSRADSIAPTDLSVTGRADLRRIPDRDGNPVNTGVAGAALEVSPGLGAAEGILVVNPKLAWSFFDLACSPFDPITQCWFEESLNDGNFAVVDLAALHGGGDTARLLVGPTGADFRLAEVAWFGVEIRRYAPAAAPYFLSLSRAVNPSGSIFDERPRPVAGNIQAVQGGGEEVLGYFGVAESLPRYFPTVNNGLIRQRAGRPVCLDGNRDVAIAPRFDCCFCDRTQGASTEKPSYLP